MNLSLKLEFSALESLVVGSWRPMTRPAPNPNPNPNPNWRLMTRPGTRASWSYGFKIKSLDTRSLSFEIEAAEEGLVEFEEDSCCLVPEGGGRYSIKFVELWPEHDPHNFPAEGLQRREVSMSLKRNSKARGTLIADMGGGTFIHGTVDMGGGKRLHVKDMGGGTVKAKRVDVMPAYSYDEWHDDEFIASKEDEKGKITDKKYWRGQLSTMEGNNTHTSGS